MPSIEYEAIYKRALVRIDDIGLANFTQEDFYDYLREWLHTASSEPLFRKKFSSFSLDDELMQLNFTLSYNVDDDYDKNLAVMIGSDKEKKLIGNYSKNMERLNDLKREWERNMTRHSYYFTEYGGSNG